MNRFARKNQEKVKQAILRRFPKASVKNRTKRINRQYGGVKSLLNTNYKHSKPANVREIVRSIPAYKLYRELFSEYGQMCFGFYLAGTGTANIANFYWSYSRIAGIRKGGAQHSTITEKGVIGPNAAIARAAALANIAIDKINNNITGYVVDASRSFEEARSHFQRMEHFLNMSDKVLATKADDISRNGPTISIEEWGRYGYFFLQDPPKHREQLRRGWLYWISEKTNLPLVALITNLYGGLSEELK